MSGEAGTAGEGGPGTMRVYDARACELGEGPFWHPERRQLFWFDILGKRLLSRTAEGLLEWRFGEHVSAAGWIDRETLLIATETGLRRFDIASGAHEPVASIEETRLETRSNDGRADPFGGFWIGTMGKAAEPGAGAIYRYHRGIVEPLMEGLSIPNAICFAPDGRRAYFADTPEQRIMTVTLDGDGWPDTPPEVFVDLREEGLNPDGAVCDARGGVWSAQWGAGRVARYTAEGCFDRAIKVGGRHASCPAFGGEGLKTLFVTTAREGIGAPDVHQGRTYAASLDIAGLPEAQVIAARA